MLLPQNKNFAKLLYSLKAEIPPHFIKNVNIPFSCFIKKSKIFYF